MRLIVKQFKIFLMPLAWLLLCLPLLSLADSDLDNVSVIAINTYDRNAVIKQPGQAMRVLKVGESLNQQTTLVDVLTDKVVFEEIVSHDGQRAKETIWLYKAVNGKSRIQRLSYQAPEQPVYALPANADMKNAADLEVKPKISQDKQ